MSHITALWFLATGLLHSRQGCFIGPGLHSMSPDSISESCFLIKAGVSLPAGLTFVPFGTLCSMLAIMARISIPA